MPHSAFKPNTGNFNPLSLLTLALISGFAANHGTVSATTVGPHILPTTISAPSASVTAKYWGQDDRLGNFGDLFQNLGNYNHDQGYYMLMVQQPDRYWYYPSAGASTNPWWWYVGGNLETASKVTQNIKATLKSGRYKVRPWVGKIGDQYLNISRAAPMVDVYSLKVAGAESSPYPALGAENANWKFVETINFAEPTSTFSHSATFSQLDYDINQAWAELWNTNSYRINFHLSAQLEHKTLMSRFNRYLPSGRNVTVLQAESGQTPDSAGSVKRIFQNVPAESHSTFVSEILGKAETYPLLRTKYIGASPNLRSYQTSTTADFRTFNAAATPGNWYPKTSIDGQALVPPDIMNVSNTNGGTLSSTVRHFDRMLERNSILGCTAQNGSISSGNLSVSGTSYNAIVVDQPYGLPANDSGTQINDHGVRQKPDLISFSKEATASSYSTPTVCSIAAMLIERVKADADLTNGNKPEVLKAIMMAGANRVAYQPSFPWSKLTGSETNFKRGGWFRRSDTFPLSDKYGAGYANANGAYTILDAGRQAFGSSSKSTGWDFGKDLAPGASRTYMIGVTKPTQFTAVSNWLRRISDNGNSSDLPNVDIYLKDSTGTVLAKSISSTNNVELIETQLAAGQYQLEVKRSESDTTSPVNFGVAWTGRAIVPTPLLSSGVIGGSTFDIWWTLPNNAENNYMYYVVVANDASFQSIVTEFFTTATSAKFNLSYSNKFFQVTAYPKEGSYGTEYPSNSAKK